MKRKASGEIKDESSDGDVKNKCSLLPLLSKCKSSLTEDLCFYEAHKQQVRVGRIVSGKRPSFDGFIDIVCLTKSSQYGDIGPYVLKDDEGRVVENLWQFSKVYKDIPASTQVYSRWDRTVVWSHPKEIHVDNDNSVNDAYWTWRHKGFSNPQPVRYPVGKAHARKCLYALESDNGEQLSYVDARKRIYAPVYMYLAQLRSKFTKLKNFVKEGKKILILEVDGPHQESLDYYKKKYNVDSSFIENSTMLASIENLRIMLNDTKHPFGHGYCLAMAVLGLTCKSLENNSERNYENVVSTTNTTSTTTSIVGTTTTSTNSITAIIGTATPLTTTTLKSTSTKSTLVKLTPTKLTPTKSTSTTKKKNKILVVDNSE